MCNYIKNYLPPKPDQNKTETQSFGSLCPIMLHRED